jgi:OOP family OmpA-OmpF porin
MRNGAISIFLASLLFACASSESHAQPVSGFYVAGGAGVDLSQSQTIDSGPVAGGDSGSAAERAAAAINRPSLTAIGSAGWGFGDGLRMEMQGVHSENSTGGSVP